MAGISVNLMFDFESQSGSSAVTNASRCRQRSFLSWASVRPAERQAPPRTAWEGESCVCLTRFAFARFALTGLVSGCRQLLGGACGPRTPQPAGVVAASGVQKVGRIHGADTWSTGSLPGPRQALSTQAEGGSERNQALGAAARVGARTTVGGGIESR